MIQYTLSHTLFFDIHGDFFPVARQGHLTIIPSNACAAKSNAYLPLVT